MTTFTVSQHTLTQSQNEIRIIAMLQLWMDRHAQRKQLAVLNDKQLNDIGLTRKVALKESALPFWK